MNYFENYNLISKEDSFVMNLNSEFYCLNDNVLNIKIKSSYDILESNGTNTEDGYIWKINTNNYTNVNIIHEISRDYDSIEKSAPSSNTNNNYWGIIKSALSIIVIIIILISLIKFYKKQQEV